MKRYLLIGAGFSRNWGGWLASEVFEFLLGDPDVAASPELRDLLWKHQSTGGFEAALYELERGAAPSMLRLASKLRSATRRMFDTMNQAFKGAGLEFRQPSFGGDYPVRNFLLRFEAIFTLNQDLLLEYCYRGSADGLVDRTNVRTERSWQLPGMKQLPVADEQPIFPSAAGIWVPSDDCQIANDQQRIIKLHGSSNWRTAENSDLMILGGGKVQAIEREPVLKWYSQLFDECLAQPDARLMVVGYGFRDEHINDALFRAMNRGLKLFVVDPQGADVGSVTNSVPRHAIGHRPTAFEDALRGALIGASRRNLSSTLSGDHIEYQKLERFLTSGI